MPRTNENHFEHVPITVVNPRTREKYSRGGFLGKGGFARCWKVTQASNGKQVCLKVIPKALLSTAHQKEKMEQEVEIQRSLKHENVLGFLDYFTDDKYCYIVLELCDNRSFMELHKRRKTITERECRFFLRQLLRGLKFCHENRVIHRDLKLANLMITSDLEVKIGDFGLATRCGLNERKKTLCGTPNYIAPEVLTKKGHSFEVDMWSVGCILYTLLIGKPPFETSTLNDTYGKIKACDFKIPAGRVSDDASSLIHALLDINIDRRYTVEKCLTHPFLADELVPKSLHPSCLSMAPRDSIAPRTARPLQQQNEQVYLDYGIDGLAELFKNCLKRVKHPTCESMPLDSQEPRLTPMFYITRWVDYSDKYGLGYQLNDGAFGVLYNDNTRMLSSAPGQLQYIDRDGGEAFHTTDAYPAALRKKVTLLDYFMNYMTDHLALAGQIRTPDNNSRLPYLRTWFRTKNAIILHLSNGTLQINFFADHIKCIVCPVMSAFTLLKDDIITTFSFDSFTQYGVSGQVYEKILYAQQMTEKLSSYRKSRSQAAAGQPRAR